MGAPYIYIYDISSLRVKDQQKLRYPVNAFDVVVP